MSATEHRARSAERRSLSAADQLRLYRRGAYVAEVLEAVEDTLAVHTDDTAWFERADEATQAETLRRLQEVESMAYNTEARLALSPVPGGAR